MNQLVMIHELGLLHNIHNRRLQYTRQVTRTATRSCRTKKTAVIRVWSPGGVRRRPQRAATAAAAAATADAPVFSQLSD